VARLGSQSASDPRRRAELDGVVREPDWRRHRIGSGFLSLVRDT
jgi:hypothetical protein